jgi:hypothetical protein
VIPVLAELGRGTRCLGKDTTRLLLWEGQNYFTVKARSVLWVVAVTPLLDCAVTSTV